MASLLLSGQELVDARLIFTDAFNKNRSVLAGFAKCENEEDLHVVRDGWYLGLAKNLSLPEYASVKKAVVEDMRVAMAAGTVGGFAQTINSARDSIGWHQMVAAVKAKALVVDSDLIGIWDGLESGRLEWITATKATHMLKMNLRIALDKDDAMEGDVHDAKRIWIYALATTLPGDKIAQVVQLWSKTCKITSIYEPLVGYKPELWNPNLSKQHAKTWQALELLVLDAAMRGGTDLEAAWALTTATLDVPEAVTVDLNKGVPKTFDQKARKKR